MFPLLEAPGREGKGYLEKIEDGFIDISKKKQQKSLSWG